MTKQFKQDACNIAVFFKDELPEPTPIKVLMSLFPTLKSLDFKIFLYDDPIERSITGTKTSLENRIIVYGDAFLECEIGLRRCPHASGKIQEKSMIAMLDLIHLIEYKYNFYYRNIDLSHNACMHYETQHKCLAKRDNHFIERIEDVCKEHSRVVFLVTNAHYNVVLKLFKAGYNVMGFVPVNNEYQKEEDATSAFINNFKDQSIPFMRNDPTHFKVFDCNEDNPPTCQPELAGFLEALVGNYSMQNDEL